MIVGLLWVVALLTFLMEHSLQLLLLVKVLPEFVIPKFDDL
jgi:hypothetical protein